MRTAVPLLVGFTNGLQVIRVSRSVGFLSQFRLGKDKPSEENLIGNSIDDFG